MNSKECVQCLKPKANLHCGLCQNALCKKCAQFLEEDQFSFLKVVPEELTKGIYCVSCYDEKIAPEIDAYTMNMEQAKDVFIFYKEQGKETRLMKRAEAPYKIVDCADRDEAILRMAFWAVMSGFNAVIDIELHSDKKKDGSYSLLTWRATGVPTTVDAVKHNRPTIDPHGQN